MAISGALWVAIGGYESLGAVQAAGGLAIAQLQNAAGSFIAPTESAVASGLAAAAWTDDSHAADVDGTGGPSSYPLVTLSYALVPSATPNGRATPLPFLTTAVGQGDAAVLKTGMAPLPAAGKSVVAKMAR